VRCTGEAKKKQKVKYLWGVSSVAVCGAVD